MDRVNDHISCIKDAFTKRMAARMEILKKLKEKHKVQAERERLNRVQYSDRQTHGLPFAVFVYLRERDLNQREPVDPMTIARIREERINQLRNEIYQARIRRLNQPYMAVTRRRG